MNWRKALTPKRARQLWYAPVLAFAMGLMLLRTLMMARILDAQGFAHFSLGLLGSSTFCMLACLGLQLMLQRDMPVMIVRGRERPALVLVAQCILVAWVCCMAALLAIAVGVPLLGMPTSLAAIGMLHGLSQQVFLVATVESRSRGEPLRFSLQNLLRAAAVVVFGVVAALSTKSAFWVLTIEAVTSLVLAQRILTTIFRRQGVGASGIYRIALTQLPRLHWRSAMTLLLVTVLTFTAMNVDRWAAAGKLDLHDFGQYAFAWTILMVAQSVQALINASVYPALARRFATDGRGAAFHVCAMASAAMLLGAALMCLPFWYLLSFGIRHWFPDYIAALGVLPLFLVVAVLRVSDFWSSYLIILGLEARLLLIIVAACVCGAGSWALTTSPWSGSGTSIGQLALLPVLLATYSYAAVALAAWRAAKR